MNKEMLKFIDVWKWKIEHSFFQEFNQNKQSRYYQNSDI